MVKFCDKCSNMMGHQMIDDSDDLNYVCNVCGNVQPMTDTCMVINHNSAIVQDYPLNSNMIYDMSLPRTKQIICPNKNASGDDKCTYVGDDNPEIIIFQYNPNMMRTGYMCTSCHCYWKN